MNANDRLKNLEKMVEIGLTKYQQIDHNILAVETKNGTFIVFIGVLIPIALGTGGFGPVQVLNVISVVLFVLAGGCFSWVMLAQDYRNDPNIVLFTEKYKDIDSEDFLLQLIVNMGYSIEFNLEKQRKLSTKFNFGLLLLLGSIMSFGLSHLENLL